MNELSSNETLGRWIVGDWLFEDKQVTGDYDKHTHEYWLDESGLDLACGGWLVRGNGIIGRVRFGCGR